MKIIYVAGRYRSSCEWELEEFLRLAEDAALRLWADVWCGSCGNGGLGIKLKGEGDESHKTGRL